MTDDITDPLLVARLEEIMLAEDQGRLPHRPINMRMEITHIDPAAQAEAIQLRAARFRAMSAKIDALTRHWFPSSLMRQISWQWSSSLGQGCRVKLGDYILYVEVRPDLRVIVFMQWPAVSEGEGPLEDKVMRSTQIFKAEDPVVCIIDHMRPQASRIMAAELTLHVSSAYEVRMPWLPSVDTHRGFIGTLHGMTIISDKYDHEAAARFFRSELLSLRHYHNRRKKQKRQRTGRRK